MVLSGVMGLREVMNLSEVMVLRKVMELREVIVSLVSPFKFSLPLQV